VMVLEIQEVSGDHLSVLAEPNVRRVAERLTHCLRWGATELKFGVDRDLTIQYSVPAFYLWGR
jgi:hypothetical protein